MKARKTLSIAMAFAASLAVASCFCDMEDTDNCWFDECHTDCYETFCDSTGCYECDCYGCWPSDPYCWDDFDCTLGYICESGDCVPGCRTDADCEIGQYCMSGQCRESGQQQDEGCTANDDCPGLAMCVDGQCYQVECLEDT
ncbi:MAG: hypothetical protein D6806_09085, partial [Deltaproteobacteria bacterium]